jgi:hypothetical protein
MITLGFMNGGLGLALAEALHRYIYAYSIVGGVIILSWWGFALRSELKPMPVVAAANSKRRLHRYHV